jgi:hypothetical protein
VRRAADPWSGVVIQRSTPVQVSRRTSQRIARTAFLVALIASTIAVQAGNSASYAQAANPIEVENQLPGSANWHLGLPGFSTATDTIGQIKGYASATSVNKGGAIAFYVTVNPAQSYGIDIYRIGWYQGLGGRLLQHVGPLAGVQQPTCPTDATTGLIACNWSSGYSLTVPLTWTTGVYVAVLTNSQNWQNYIIFVVRDDAPTAALLVQISDNTYQAYNNYPNDGLTGKSLYSYNSYGANTIAGSPSAVKVSFDRPYANDGDPRFFAYEYYLVRWLERSGYDVTYSSDLDMHVNGSSVLGYKGLISAGHNEYWSKPMYDATLAARDAGVHIAFFSSNTIYWQVRFEPSAGNVPNRVMVCYRTATLDPIQGPTTTVRWRDAPVNLPEQGLIGIEFTSQIGGGAPYVVTNSSHWIYAGTGFVDGSSVANIVGGEGDRQVLGQPLPASTDYTLLSHSSYTNTDGVADYANSSIYRATSGAWVFAAGTFRWSWALDQQGYIDSRIQLTTANLLARFLTPEVTSVSPTSGTASGGTFVTITGTGFSTTPGATTVAFGPTAATNVSCSSRTACTATSPAGSGIVHVTATVDGRVSTASSADQFTYTAGTITPCTGVSVGVSPSSPQPPGTTVTFTASATGCSSAEYKWWVLPPGGSWQLARDWGGTTFTWNTSGLATGTYDISVYARAVGSSVTTDVLKETLYSLSP